MADRDTVRHGAVVAEALLVTLLWSSSWVMIQIAILAWVFLGEALTAREIAGLVLAACGALVVQLRRRPRRPGVDPARR